MSPSTKRSAAVARNTLLDESARQSAQKTCIIRRWLAGLGAAPETIHRIRIDNNRAIFARNGINAEITSRAQSRTRSARAAVHNHDHRTTALFQPFEFNERCRPRHTIDGKRDAAVSRFRRTRSCNKTENKHGSKSCNRAQAG